MYRDYTDILCLAFTARIRDYIQQHQSQKVTAFDAEPHGAYRDNDSDYNTPERKETLGRNVQYSTNQQQDDSVQALDEINAKNYSTLQERYDQQNRSSASSRQAYSSNEGSRLSLNLPKRIQQNPAGDNRRDTSPVLNSSENLSHVAEVKRSGSAHLESASYLFPNAEKNTSFKKKIISDSMQRLKSSVYNSGAPTRDNSIKSGLFHEPEHTQSQAENTKKMEHELALRQMLANTSLTYENGDAKSSDDSFHTAHDRSHSMSIKKMDSMLDKMQASRDQPLSERSIIPRGNGRLEDDGSIIQLRELFRNSANEANASKLSLKKNSHPNTGRSPRDSCTASQLFRPSESESYVMNVSRLGELDDPAEIQERIEELRRYSMELGMGWNPEQNAPEPVKEVAYNRRNPSDIGESSSANEHENTRYMSSNTVEGMKSLRTPDFQSYASQMKDNHFFALHNQQDNARNGAGAQKRNNSNEGKKKSIINKFSKELEKGLASRLPVPQPRPIDPQESSEYPESQEMMGFLSFSKEHGRTDASETLHSPDKYGYDASVSYSRELPERSNLRRALQEEEKERAQNSFAMEKKLAEASNKVNIKTFLALRSILKPHRAIVLCCEGLVKLLSGFDDIPANLEEQESVEWGQIKALFNSPVKIVNLVSTFKTLANSGKITAQKIEAVELVLSRIQVHLDTPQHEAFSQLHSFLVAAVQYYESCFQDTYYNIRRETFEEPEKTAPVPMQYTAAPQNKPRIPTASNNVYKPVASGSRKSPLQSRYSQGKYSPQKVEPNKVQRQSKSVGRVRPPSDKKDRENQGNTSNITRNSGQNFRKEEQTRSTQQDKSASKTPTKKNVSSKIDNKRVVLGQKSLENNYMKEKEIYEDNEMSGDGVRFLVDVEQSEAGELKDTIEAKEKEAREYRNKVKKMLFEHDRFVRKMRDDLCINKMFIGQEVFEAARGFRRRDQ